MLIIDFVIDCTAEMRNMVCQVVQIELVLKDITGEVLNRGANWISGLAASGSVSLGVWSPSADSYKELTPAQISQMRENEKKGQCARRVLEIEQGKFTPLAFITII